MDLVDGVETHLPKLQRYASSGNADSLNFASARELGQEMLVKRGLEKSFRVSKKDRFDTRTYETQHRV
jgi:hypothetical protein